MRLESDEARNGIVCVDVSLQYYLGTVCFPYHYHDITMLFQQIKRDSNSFLHSLLSCGMSMFSGLKVVPPKI